MPKFIVRPRLGGQAKDTGKEGAQATVVFAPTDAKAREMGARQLGLGQGAVEVIPYGIAPPVIGRISDAPIDPEELKDVMNQETKIVPGSWEH